MTENSLTVTLAQLNRAIDNLPDSSEAKRLLLVARQQFAADLSRAASRIEMADATIVAMIAANSEMAEAVRALREQLASIAPEAHFVSDLLTCDADALQEAYGLDPNTIAWAQRQIADVIQSALAAIEERGA